MTWKTACLVLFCLAPLTRTAHGKIKDSGSLAEKEEQEFFRKYQIRNMKFASFDGTKLGVRLYEPDIRIFPGRRPSIIFANSWTMEEHEYEHQARRYAAEGFLVLSYATRGFGASEGKVGVAHADDVKDISSLIDWLETNTMADPQHLAVAGVSYGGGLALLASATEPRIRTAVSISGWGDLEQSIYGGDTIRKVWLDILLRSGMVLGRLSPELFKQVDRLRNNYEVDAARSWAQARSSSHWIDHINARETPIFIANSYHDNLFPPAQIRGLFENLKGPKKFYMDRGIHTSSSISGILGLPSPVWDEVYRWMNHWLKEQNTGILQEPPISFQTANGREYFNSFPELSNQNSHQKLTIDTNNLLNPDNQKKILIYGGVDSGATSGIPILSEIATGIFQKPIQIKFDQINKRFALVMQSEPILESWKLRGSPRVKIHLDPHEGPIQLIAYLYDIDSEGTGTLITHGVISHREGAKDSTAPTWDLAISAYNIDEGHRLGLVIDTIDPLYQSPKTSRYMLTIDNSADREPELTLPIAE